MEFMKKKQCEMISCWDFYCDFSLTYHLDSPPVVLYLFIFMNEADLITGVVAPQSCRKCLEQVVTAYQNAGCLLGL